MACVLSVTVRNGKEECLDRVLGLLRRRCVPVCGITYTESVGTETLSFQISLDTRLDSQTRQAVTQLRRLPDVLDVVELKQDEYVRELALVSVYVPEPDQSGVLELVQAFCPKLAGAGPDFVTLEIVDHPERIDGLVSQLRPVGPLQVTRTGSVFQPVRRPSQSQAG